MSDDATFTENPFRALNAKLFPEKGKKGSAVPAAVSRPTPRRGPQSKAFESVQDKTTSTSTRETENADNLEESRIFLQAMSRGQQPTGRKSKTKHGFMLTEHCALPSGKDLKKARAVSKINSAPLSAVPDKATASGVDGFVERKPGHAGSAISRAPAGSESVLSVQDEEAEAFLRAMNQVQPLQARGREVTPEPCRSNLPPPQAALSLQDYLDGKLEFALSFSDEYLEGHVVGLDQMIMNKLRAGALSPEAHLDLHGLNAVQAFEALRGFMRGCWYKGLRTVLVVPGRGRNSPDGMGVLREKLQSWLTQDPFKRVVLAFCTARPHDGGPGSVYVLLRKYRKKGRIYWERMPADGDLY